MYRDSPLSGLITLRQAMGAAASGMPWRRYLPRMSGNGGTIIGGASAQCRMGVKALVASCIGVLRKMTSPSGSLLVMPWGNDVAEPIVHTHTPGVCSAAASPLVWGAAPETACGWGATAPWRVAQACVNSAPKNTIRAE